MPAGYIRVSPCSLYQRQSLCLSQSMYLCFSQESEDGDIPVDLCTTAAGCRRLYVSVSVSLCFSQESEDGDIPVHRGTTGAGCRHLCADVHKLLWW